MVSVIVPVYNIEDYLKECLDSLRNQSYRDIEIILIDDGSSDRSGKICDAYAAMDMRIKVIHKENEGVSSARNAGLEIMQGDYVLFADGDDWLDTNMIQELFESMQKSEAQMAICDTYQTDGTNFEVRNLFKYAKNKKIFYEKEIYDIIKYTATLWNKLIERKCIEDIRFDTKISYGEDLLFLVQILKNVNKIVIVNKPLYYYRNSRVGNVASSSINNSYMEFIDTTYIIYKMLMEKNYQIAATIRLSYALNRTIEFIPVSEIYQSKKYLRKIKNILRNNPEIYKELKFENGIGKRKIITLKIAKYNTILAVIVCRFMKRIYG